VKDIPAAPLLVVLVFGLGGVVAALGSSDSAVASARYEKYDDYFQKYTKLYFDDRGDHVGWQLLKAQAIVESNLIPTVVSSEHAVGLMQLVPGTYEEVRQQMRQENKKLGRQKNQELGDIKDPESNIRAGIWYDHAQFAIWKPRSESLPLFRRIGARMKKPRVKSAAAGGGKDLPAFWPYPPRSFLKSVILC